VRPPCREGSCPPQCHRRRRTCWTTTTADAGIPLAGR
jgi:hypothetical protein